MRPLVPLVGLLSLLSTAAYAADGEVPRARGLSLALAVEASQATIAACRAKGFKVTVEVKDSAGITVSILSDDGAAASSIAAVRLRNLVALKYRTASGEISDRAAHEPALAAEIADDAKIKTASRGAVPLFARGTFIGAYGVAGAPNGLEDELCAQAGLSRIAARVR